MRVSLSALVLTALTLLYALALLAGLQTADGLMYALLFTSLYGATALLWQWAVTRDLLLLKVYVVYFSVWYLTRIPSLVAWPDTYSYTTMYQVSDALLTRDLLLLLLYFLVAAAVIVFLDQRFQLHLPRQPESLDRTIAIAFIWWSILLPLAVLSVVLPQWGGGIFSFVQHVLDTNFITIFLGLLVAASYPWRSFGTRWRVIVFVASFLGYTLAQGSRSGLYRLVLYALLVLLAQPRAQIKLTLRRTVAAVLVMAASVTIFYVSTVVRLVRRDSPDHVVKLSELPGYFRLFTFSHGAYQLSYPVLILQRLSTLDYFMVVVDRQETRMAHEVSFSNVFKNIANEIVPGDIFPGVLPSYLAFDIDYEDQSYDTVVNNYSSRVPGLPATAIALSNQWAGLAVETMLLAAYGLLALLALELTPPQYRFYTVLLILHWAYSLYLTMGVDEFFFSEMIGTVLVQGGLYLLFAGLWTRVRQRGTWPQPQLRELG
jgi:hypothetical protein